MKFRTIVCIASAASLGFGSLAFAQEGTRCSSAFSASCWWPTDFAVCVNRL
jgi:hypothetical protein